LRWLWHADAFQQRFGGARVHDTGERQFTGHGPTGLALLWLLALLTLYSVWD
jgi:hypothetical protein